MASGPFLFYFSKKTSFFLENLAQEQANNLSIPLRICLKAVKKLHITLQTKVKH